MGTNTTDNTVKRQDERTTRLGGKDFPTSDYIIGLPSMRSDSISHLRKDIIMDNVFRDTMPIMEIVPGFQESGTGLTTFNIKEGMDESPQDGGLSFIKELSDKYKIEWPENQKSIKVAYINNGGINETFSNDFGESMVNKLANTASDGIREFTFATNTRNTKGAIAKAKGLMEGLTGSSSAVDSMDKNLDSLMNMGGGWGNIVGNIALGNRIEFPSLWKSSTWSPTYSISVRLMNMFPNSIKHHRQQIIGPLAVLLMFVVPRTTDGYTFHWPWLCSFKSPGMFGVKGGYIKSISVIKGGDNNVTSWTNRPTIVDLKIDFGVLHNTMMSSSNSDSGVPTLTGWLDNLEERKRFAGEPGEGITAGSNNNADRDAPMPDWYSPDDVNFNFPNVSLASPDIETKGFKTTPRAETPNTVGNPRVSTDQFDIEKDLLSVETIE